MPNDIVSDRDGKFTSLFWQELFSQLGSKLSLSSARHPETDGQTERTIQMLENYLRHYIKYNQKDWDDKLFLAEFAYSNSWQDTIKMTPFQADGQNPLTPSNFLTYQQHQSGNQGVDDVLSGHAENLRLCQKILEKVGIKSGVKYTKQEEIKITPQENNAKQLILLAQERMAKYANRNR